MNIIFKKYNKQYVYIAEKYYNISSQYVYLVDFKLPNYNPSYLSITSLVYYMNNNISISIFGNNAEWCDNPQGLKEYKIRKNYINDLHTLTKYLNYIFKTIIYYMI